MFGSHDKRDPERLRHCPDCEEDVHLSEGALYERCPFCGCTALSRPFRGGEPRGEGGAAAAGAAAPEPPAETSAGPADAGAMLRSLFLFGDQPSFLPLGGGAPDGAGGLAELVAAQQGVDVEALIERMLGDSELNAPPASKQYLETLAERPLGRRDFVQVFVGGVARRPVFVTAAAFGPQLQDAHDADAGDGEDQAHVTAAMAAAEPRSGRDLRNGEALRGRVCLLARGEVTFADKVRAAQRAGAAAAVVTQAPDGVWPYRMTDTSGTSGDVTLPAVMASPADAAALEAAAAEGREVSLCTRRKHVACPVCRDDFELGQPAVTLPCAHTYHLDTCLRPWLERRSTCPLCRYQLPADTDEEEARRADAARAQEQLRAGMFT